MALFTQKEDKNLPLLTKASQIDTTDPEELAAIVREVTGSDIEGQYIRLAFAWESKGASGLRLPPSAEEVGRETTLALRDRSAKVCRLAYNVMNDIAQSNRIATNDLIALREFPSAHIFAPADFDYGHVQPGGYIPVDKLTEAHFVGNHPFGAAVVRELETLILDVITGRGKVLFCPECGMPFPKKRRTYCSYRCQHRVSERVRYNNLFESDGKSTSEPSEKRRRS